MFSDQRAPGKISLSQISQILNDGTRVPDLEWVYFGGGEPFTQYPLLLKGVQRARKLGYKVGVETNGYFARSIKAGIRFLRPLAGMGLNNIRISNDRWHYKNPESSPAAKAIQAAQKLGISTTVVHIPSAENHSLAYQSSGIGISLYEPRLMYAGRAAETLAEGTHTFQTNHYHLCPRDDLEYPERLYIDAYGFVQICPGIAIGNIQNKSFDRIVEGYKPTKHKIIRILKERGPRGLVRKTPINLELLYADACHCCFTARKALLDIYPELLGPRLVYGY